MKIDMERAHITINGEYAGEIQGLYGMSNIDETDIRGGYFSPNKTFEGTLDNIKMSDEFSEWLDNERKRYEQELLNKSRLEKLCHNVWKSRQ